MDIFVLCGCVGGGLRKSKREEGGEEEKRKRSVCCYRLRCMSVVCALVDVSVCLCKCL
jgi:hypothetical protein